MALLLVSHARLSHGEERVWSNSHQALVLHTQQQVLNEVGVNMIGTCSEKEGRLALQVACQKRQPRAPFATKSPRNSWRVRHEMMMGIRPDYR